MTLVTSMLHEEHHELLPAIEELRSVANSIGAIPVDRLRPRIDAAHVFLSEHLIPHAHAEDAALYPVVGRLMGAAQATATMSRDHVEVGRLTAELDMLRRAITADELDDNLARELRRVLYGLYTLIRVHFAKEEEIYLPLLDAQLTEGDARGLIAAMERAAAEARAQLGR